MSLVNLQREILLQLSKTDSLLRRKANKFDINICYLCGIVPRSCLFKKLTTPLCLLKPKNTNS